MSFLIEAKKMIVSSNGFWYKSKTNAMSVNVCDKFRLSLYAPYLGKIPKGMKVLSGHTSIIDLTQSEEDILLGMKSNTRNEIRRAIREHFSFEKVESLDEFITFYNNFSQEKKLSEINKKHLLKYKEHVVMYRSGIGGVTLSMHATILDPEVKKAALLYSASVRLDYGCDRKNVGFSNRFLHYMEFLEFKKIGYRFYDFSGVCIDSNKPEKYSIGQFKKGFGGVEVDTIQLMSYSMALALFIRRIRYKISQ